MEAHTAGPLTGWAVDHDYDTLHRRADLKVLEGTTPRALTHYTYDDASRFHTIGDGTRTATYAYLTNRGLVEHVTFHNGTADAMRTSRQYDALGRLTLIGHTRLVNVGGGVPPATGLPATIAAGAFRRAMSERPPDAGASCRGTTAVAPWPTAAPAS